MIGLPVAKDTTQKFRAQVHIVKGFMDLFPVGIDLATWDISNATALGLLLHISTSIVAMKSALAAPTLLPANPSCKVDRIFFLGACEIVEAADCKASNAHPLKAT